MKHPLRSVRAGILLGMSLLALTGCGLFGKTATNARLNLNRKSHSVNSPKVSLPGPVTVKGQTAKTATGLGGAIGVIIDNLPQARPQSGLSHASMVFEAPAEGGITRFLALFWQAPASQIGPIRSTRIYFDQLAQGYQIPLAHAGGNVDALKAIGPLHIENLDQIYTPGISQDFWRTTTRQAPHNLYTSTGKLLAAVAQKGYTLGPIPSWPVGTLQTGEPARTVTVTFSGVEQARWIYHHGLYTRYEGQTEDLTLAGHPITARAVLCLVTPQSPDPDPYTPGSIKLAMTGQGPGYLAADGHMVQVTWTREAGHPFVIETRSGHGLEPIPAPPLWVELIPYASAVSASGS